MQFRKVTANKYIGSHGYSLVKAADGMFTVCRNSVPASWGNCFMSVKAAETFLNSHDYINATTDSIPLNLSDVSFIFDTYGKKCLNHAQNSLYGIWTIDDAGRYTIECECDGPDFNNLSVNIYRGSTFIGKYTSMDPLIAKLDEIVGDSIFANIILRGVELRPIFAKAMERRSTREVTQNLIRVKSSNVWAYGVEIKDNNAKEGDVYVQFKGKDGGPGDVYKFYTVPISLWRKFIGAPSKGHFVWKYLRNNFLYSKLTGDKKGKLRNAVNN